jgi:hypothetical protein
MTLAYFNPGMIVSSLFGERPYLEELLVDIRNFLLIK